MLNDISDENVKLIISNEMIFRLKPKLKIYKKVSIL